QRLDEPIASGVAENIGVVSGNTVELSRNLNVPLDTPGANGKVPEGPPPQAPPPEDGQLGTPSPPPQAPLAIVPAGSGHAGPTMQNAVDTRPPLSARGPVPPGNGQLASPAQNSVPPQPPPASPNQPVPIDSGGPGATGSPVGRAPAAAPAPSIGG